VDFRVLGPVEVVAEETSGVPGGPIPRAILAVLLVADGPVDRDRLIDELWGADPPRTAVNALHVHLTALRRLCGERLRTTTAGYLFVPAADDSIDLVDFGSALREATLHGLRTAAGMWRGTPFGGARPTPSLEAEASRLADLHADALHRLGLAALETGDEAGALAELVPAVALYPTDEHLVATLMLAQHRMGRSPDALRTYRALERAVDSELGMPPGPEVSSLARAIERHDPTLSRPASPRLPIAPTRFVGRAEQLAAASDLLGRHRVLTIVGPAGVGKTRLADELIRRSAADYPGGVLPVDLSRFGSELDQGAELDLPAELVAVLELRVEQAAAVPALLAAHAAGRRLLLVLDNCEHLLASCASLIADVLAEAPSVRVLATSRIPLGVPAEQVYALAGLALPSVRAEPVEIAEAEAVQLFATRLAEARSGQALLPGEVLAAGDLCRRLDGLPLALEVAAVRARTMAISEIHARLDAQIDILARRGLASGAHASLQASLDWSVDLLPERLRRMYARLSVFEGPAEADTMATVVGSPDDALATVIDDVAELADQSLLTVDLSTVPTRYRMLAVIRLHAHRLLQSLGEQDSLQDRHTAMVVELAARAAEPLSTYDPAWLRRINTRHDDIRAAVDRLVLVDPESALRICTQVWWYWLTGSRSAEGLSRLEECLRRADGAGWRLMTTGHRAAGALARQMGELTSAQRHIEAALDLAQRAGDEQAIATCLGSLAITLTALGDLDSAASRADQAIAIHRRTGNHRAVANGLNNLAVIERGRKQLELADELLAAAEEAAVAAGAKRLLAAIWTNQATVARRQGRFADGRLLAEDALRSYTELEYVDGQLDGVEGVALALIGLGDFAAGLTVLEVSGRERDACATYSFVPDEMSERDAAENLARKTLGSAESRLCRERARGLGFAELVARLLGS
jgi:predicted ATPase/DNA-binding SARP family transcriptional activator